MEVNDAPELLFFPHSSEYLPLCSAEQRHSYRFGTTWGWVKDDSIFIFGWTIPLVNMFLCMNVTQPRLVWHIGLISHISGLWWKNPLERSDQSQSDGNFGVEITRTAPAKRRYHCAVFSHHRDYALLSRRLPCSHRTVTYWTGDEIEERPREINSMGSRTIWATSWTETTNP